MQTTIKQIQQILSLDLLSPQWRKLVQPGDHFTRGHCYAASEALYHLVAKDLGYKPMVLPLGDGQTHWFLRNSSGEVLDVTAEQFPNPIDYSKGRGCGWLSGDKPSARCREIMQRVCGDRSIGRTAIIQIDNAGSKLGSPLQSSWTPDLLLEFCSSADPRYVDIRKDHYVKTKGQHQGQQVHFLIWYKGEIIGIISGASSALGVAARDQFFGITAENRKKGVLNGIICNVIFRLVNHEKNLGSQVLSLWQKAAIFAWEALYDIPVYGFETFIVRQGQDGIIRDGSMYKASGWSFVGEIRRNPVIPSKEIYCKWIHGHSKPLESEYESSWKKSTPEETLRAKQLTRARKSLMGVQFYIQAHCCPNWLRTRLSTVKNTGHDHPLLPWDKAGWPLENRFPLMDAV